MASACLIAIMGAAERARRNAHAPHVEKVSSSIRSERPVSSEDVASTPEPGGLDDGGFLVSRVPPLAGGKAQPRGARDPRWAAGPPRPGAARS